MTYHVPVLLQESLEGLQVREGGVYADLTLGGGGHSRAILDRLNGRGHLYCFDKDSSAIANLPDSENVTGVHSDFRHFANWMRYYKIERIDGALIDLGVSSHMFDAPERGFSFMGDGPLDMRMNSRAQLDARHLIDNLSVETLADIFRENQVESSWKIADAIKHARRIGRLESTNDLLECARPFARAPHLWQKNMARIFQALRIEVNDEMGALESALSQLPEFMAPGARLVVISYHSLEDLRVKLFLREGRMSRHAPVPEDRPFRVITKKAVAPTEEEVELNSRARSARMRVGERV